MKEHDRKVIYYYYCLFKQNKSLYYEFYERKFLDRSFTYARLSAKGHDFINSSYHEAVHVYNLDPEEYDKKRFLTLLAQDGFYNPHKYTFRKYCIVYRDRNKTNHFVKQDHHIKKEISEKAIQKKEWREKKGFSKDQSKTKTWKRGAGAYYKKLSNDMHRSWEKEMMDNGRYDEMCNNDYKLYISDHWMWN